MKIPDGAKLTPQEIKKEIDNLAPDWTRNIDVGRRVSLAAAEKAYREGRKSVIRELKADSDKWTVATVGLLHTWEELLKELG